MPILFGYEFMNNRYELNKKMGKLYKFTLSQSNPMMIWNDVTNTAEIVAKNYMENHDKRIKNVEKYYDAQYESFPVYKQISSDKDNKLLYEEYEEFVLTIGIDNKLISFLENKNIGTRDDKEYSIPIKDIIDKKYICGCSGLCNRLQILVDIVKEVTYVINDKYSIDVIRFEKQKQRV